MKRTVRICFTATVLAGALLTGGATTATATTSPSTTPAAAVPVPPPSEGPAVSREMGLVQKADVSTAQDAPGVQAAPCWYSSGNWWCNNISGAGVYINDNGQARLVGTMYSNPSWFICRSDDGGYVGGPHPYRWEWTQADNGAWGWMRDIDISSETDPLPVC
ncbi:hypothetical protein ACFYXC_37155 [Streptomyces sp. NPDC002701]|uniref:hypothetical protein n=1 Tax=Streptomyces sp. NPDC002701 TaxID=3364661 RepID=UPI0036B3EFE9